MDMTKIGKKGQEVNFFTIVGIIGLFIVAVLFLTFGSDVVADVNADQTANSAAANVSTNGLTGLINLSGQFGNVGTVIGAALIIGVLITGFVVGRRFF